MPTTAPCLHIDDQTGRKCWNDCVQGTGYCEEHQKEPWFGSTWWDRKPRNWRDIVRRVIQRDQGLCYLCGNIGSQVDHKVPKYLGGSDDLWNLAVICVPCHKKKIQQEAEAAKQSMKAKRR